MCIYYVYIGISVFLSELKLNVFVVSYEELKYFINEVYWSWITTFIYSYLFLSLCNFYRLGPNSHINMKFCLGLHYSKWNIYHTNVKNISFSILKIWYFDIPYINFYYIYITNAPFAKQKQICLQSSSNPNYDEFNVYI